MENGRTVCMLCWHRHLSHIRLSSWSPPLFAYQVSIHELPSIDTMPLAVTVGRRSGAVCVCVNACFSLTPSDAASGVTRRCCSLLRAQVAQSIAKVQWNGRQLCQCMPYCCCRRLGVDVKRHRVRSLGRRARPSPLMVGSSELLIDM